MPAETQSEFKLRDNSCNRELYMYKYGEEWNRHDAGGTNEKETINEK